MPRPKPLLERSLLTPSNDLVLSRNKMLFLSGPRQAGKTTLAKQLTQHSPASYFNWDDSEFKRTWAIGSKTFGNSLLEKDIRRIVLDELHKNPKWKNQLKGFFDHFGDQLQIIVTGSAMLNVYRKGADSLTGRFVHFHVHPLSLGEIVQSTPISFRDFCSVLVNFEPPLSTSQSRDCTDSLFKFSGFPEPYLSQSEQISRIWTKGRVETMIRQDLRETSQILQMSQVEILASFLPERVSSQFSLQSISEDLDVAYTTALRWVRALESIYFHFAIYPYSKSIPRSLKKESKIYLYDWSAVPSDEGRRFENMVACHLKKFVDYYNDTGQAELGIWYLRDKEKNEVDFLVTHKNKPLFTAEVKLTDRALDKTFLKFQRKFSVPHFQIIKSPGVLQKDRSTDRKDVFVVSFDRFFAGLP